MSQIRCSISVGECACSRWTMPSTPSLPQLSSSVVRLSTPNSPINWTNFAFSLSLSLDRPSLCEPRKVEEIQEHYIETLRSYVDSHRPPNKCHFAKLLGILTELRTLGNINSEMCVSLKVQNKKLPPFLAEIWDIQDS